MGSQQASDRFVGRAEELAVLDQLLDVLDAAQPALLELRGEPGIGKTRLLRELAERADTRGLLVLVGSGSELETELPFSVFVDALDEYLRGLGSSSFAPLDDEVRTELAHVFPSLSALASGSDVALQHERYRGHRAVRSLLEQLAADKPLVLVLDDFHWADFASVELLGALLRRPPTAAVAITVAMRPRQVPERLAIALERAARAGTLKRVGLDVLTPAEAQELLGERIDPADATVLYQETGGNPFYLEQLARSPNRVETTLLDGGRVATDVPAAVSASLAEEVMLLAPDARLVLEGGAVAGDPFEPELAAAAAETSPEAAIDAIDELLRYDLVRTTDVPRRFRFRHPLVRHTVYEATAPGWRLGAHERCARLLEARDAPPTARAHHVERSAREGETEAARLLRQAGEEAARLAPASAAHWFGEALRLLPRAAPVEERIELLREQAAALTATGRYAESHQALLQALALASKTSDGAFVALSRACAGVEEQLGQQRQAATRLETALRRLSDRESAQAISLMLELAINKFYVSGFTRFDEMHGLAQDALAAAQRLGDRPRTAGALAVLGYGNPREIAEQRRAEAAALVDGMSDDELAEYLEAARWVGGLDLYLDRYREADAHATRALTIARATGRGELFQALTELLGGIWRHRGKLAEAAELLDGAIESARLLENMHALVANLSGRSSVQLLLGNVDAALETAREAVELSAETEKTTPYHAAEAAAVLASVLLVAGQAEEATELLLERAGGEELRLLAGSYRALYLEVLTRCFLALERREDAAHAAESARVWASSVDLPMAHAWAERATAAVLFASGEGEPAAERALAGAARAEGVDAPVEAALARTLAGRALAQIGERDRAIAELQRAAAQLNDRGCVRYRDAAEYELGKLGARPHRRTSRGSDEGGIEALTGRELGIARLVVERKTNAEIAAELFLSQKTIEAHLRNMFRKLNVGSRVELARVVEGATESASGSE